MAAKALNVNSPFLRGPKITNLSPIRKNLALMTVRIFHA
ncbi:hypothetical protein B4123_1354 [Bacillus paralicheniformis]|uniref:Uncharacterized protein n=1 Tax=Bacillus paralicheniformis TaxID=1648923 RepID=A0A6N2GLS4_9BACI|nr:hypothetical protein B4121_2422 [Bacillus paralicheniformis]OLG12208.1 hypothetical protein B4123_1354 [Bacillus paralicheniformis]TWJ41781.1 hypothetical protein CHCC5027_3841 [Bacillus paralicheniformis]TWJ51563.1 hypothetical protein CHCC5023_0295 [Bacillus paralicheniformis]TWJ63702.1 hypothetical protein CHCC5021_2646 [Bacillus paralicheniformis]